MERTTIEQIKQALIADGEKVDDLADSDLEDIAAFYDALISPETEATRKQMEAKRRRESVTQLIIQHLKAELGEP